jgi:hypothetical protein
MKLKSFNEFRKEVIAELGNAIQKENITSSDIDHLAHLDIMVQYAEFGRFPYGYKQPDFYK